ncbi:WXG100 family type VII secretion target [Labedella phragmitis]|uniref:WXG100 family type VII secretion target n=2 Tax=Labedella phragmitis TaxID=2498849 RepID=A0A444PZ06_9MICO|nr:WXG100 family type VII secretion target [Labedella phragmitis]
MRGMGTSPPCCRRRATLGSTQLEMPDRRRRGTSRSPAHHDRRVLRRHSNTRRIVMADIKVTSESLAGVASQLSSGSQSIESQLQNLKGLVDGLVGGDWSGTASQSFNELYSQWDQSALQLKESLQGISELLNQASLTYEDSEQSISGLFRG